MNLHLLHHSSPVQVRPDVMRHRKALPPWPEDRGLHTAGAEIPLPTTTPGGLSDDKPPALFCSSGLSGRGCGCAALRTPSCRLVPSAASVEQELRTVISLPPLPPNASASIGGTNEQNSRCVAAPSMRGARPTCLPYSWGVDSKVPRPASTAPSRFSIQFVVNLFVSHGWRRRLRRVYETAGWRDPCSSRSSHMYCDLECSSGPPLPLALR